MKNEITEEFDKLFKAIDECIDNIRDILKDAAYKRLQAVIDEANEFEAKLNKKIKVYDPEELRSECITFLRDFGVKESYKGTEYLIYVLLNHRSSEVINLSKLYEEVCSVYHIPSHTVRASFVSALKSVDEDYITPKESLYMIMRDWEIYKKDKELE